MSPFEHLSIGQNLKLQVLRQLEQQSLRSACSAAGATWWKAACRSSVGAQVDAQVEAMGDKLELRYLHTAPRSDAPSAPDNLRMRRTAADARPRPPWLDALAAQYRVPLTAQAKATIARSAAQVGDPGAHDARRLVPAEARRSG